MEFEGRGLPTTTLFTQAFAGLAEVVSAGRGMPDLHRVVFPHPLNDAPEEDIRTAVRERVPQILEGLLDVRSGRE